MHGQIMGGRCLLHWAKSAQYKLDDNWQFETGLNYFFGRCDYTFFGQFEPDSNLLIGVRYGFSGID